VDNTGSRAKVVREGKEGILTNGRSFQGHISPDEADNIVGMQLLDMLTTVLNGV
jgi:hypothetical protein